MATVNNPEDQEQNQQPGSPLAVSGTGGASSSGGQGAGVAGAAPQSPVAQNQAPQANTGYTDVGTYLDANKAGSADLGNKVASNLTDQYNSTKSGVQASAQSAQGAANKGYTPENTDLIKQVVNNPTAVAADDNNTALVQGQLNDRYTGPTTWEDQGTQQGKVNDAMQTGALTTTPGGLNVLTQQTEGKTGGSQSQGINQLDTLLLGGSPDAMSKVQSAADPFKTLNDYINQQNTAVTSSISSGQTAADKARTDAQTALLGPNGATGKLNSQVDAETAAARSAAQTQVDQVKAALGKENPTATDLASIGVSQDQWQALQTQLNAAQTSHVVTAGQTAADTATTDINLQNWLSQQSPDTALTRQNVASADEYSRAQALQKLVGADNFTTDLTDPSQAGTAPKNLNSFDYQGALGTTTATAGAEQSAAQAYVDALQSGADEAHAQAAARNAAKNVAESSMAFMPVGTTIAATEGALSGGKAAVENVGQQFSSPTRAGQSILENIATGGLSTPARAVAQGAQAAVKTITNIFCFHPDTLIEMADGRLMPICRLDVGDATRGGNVLAIKKAVSDYFFWYQGVIVTGFHAVKEDGKWIRVKDSSKARRIENYVEVVHNLVTPTHRIWSNGIEFADEHETDEYELLDLHESLEALNRESMGRLL